MLKGGFICTGFLSFFLSFKQLLMEVQDGVSCSFSVIPAPLFSLIQWHMGHKALYPSVDKQSNEKVKA